MKQLSVICLLCCIGCGGTSRNKIHNTELKLTVPQQSALLAMVPYNIDFVFAMNVKRIRTHHQLKHLWTTKALMSSNIANITMRNLVNADEMVMVSTSVGTGNADTLTLIRGSNVLSIPNSVRIDKRTIAIGSKQMITMIQQTINGERSSIINKRNNVINAMLIKALNFSVYALGCFTFDARVSLVRLLDLNSVPVCLSAWRDVVDDLAIIVHLTGKDALEAVELKKISCLDQKNIETSMGKALGIIGRVSKDQCCSNRQLYSCSDVIKSKIFSLHLKQNQS